MKSTYFLIINLTVFLFYSCGIKNIEISTDFDHGSFGDWNETKPDYIRGNTRHWIKRDSIGDQYYWFYFQADNVQGRNITFELADLTGVYRGGLHLVYTDYTQPVYSYDQQNWERITEVSYDSTSNTFTFREQFNSQPVWIAYAQPYSFSRYESLISDLIDKEHTHIRKIAQSNEGREVNLVTITDEEIQNEEKMTILLMALQHAGEDAGGFYVEGIIDFLLSDNPDADLARKRFNWQFVPMMNPDGIFNGISRYNSNMEDLNNIWLDENRAQPPVTGVKNWVREWQAAGHSIDLFIDVHNHTQFHKYHVFIAQDHQSDSLVDVIGKHWPVRIWHSEFKGSSCAWFAKEGIQSMTLELSQSRVDDGPYLKIEDYREYGEGTVKGILEYYKM